MASCCLHAIVCGHIEKSLRISCERNGVKNEARKQMLQFREAVDWYFRYFLHARLLTWSYNISMRNNHRSHRRSIINVRASCIRAFFIAVLYDCADAFFTRPALTKLLLSCRAAPNEHASKNKEISRGVLAARFQLLNGHHS